MPEQVLEKRKRGRPKGKQSYHRQNYKSKRNRQTLEQLKTFNPKQTAEYLGLGERVVRNMIRDGGIASFKSGNRAYVPRSAADAWLQSFAEKKSA